MVLYSKTPHACGVDPAGVVAYYRYGQRGIIPGTAAVYRYYTRYVQNRLNVTQMLAVPVSRVKYLCKMKLEVLRVLVVFRVFIL